MHELVLLPLNKMHYNNEKYLLSTVLSSMGAAHYCFGICMLKLDYSWYVRMSEVYQGPWQYNRSTK